ncbi:MAG: hypothetical protein Q8S84_07015 [bacterium]|nr:hypothetical protein [bacterium]MDP3381208.1 hypothetical protein [bacterium]
MSEEEINYFNNLYNTDNLPFEEKNKYTDEIEEEFYNYFINLKENEMIEFMNSVKNLILSKTYMSNYDKTYKIKKVILNCLFSFVEENRERYNLEILKKYFYNEWDFLINFRDEKDNYLIEKREYYDWILKKM